VDTTPEALTADVQKAHHLPRTAVSEVYVLEFDGTSATGWWHMDALARGRHGRCLHTPVFATEVDGQAVRNRAADDQRTLRHV